MQIDCVILTLFSNLLSRICCVCVNQTHAILCTYHCARRLLIQEFDYSHVIDQAYLAIPILVRTPPTVEFTALGST